MLYGIDMLFGNQQSAPETLVEEVYDLQSEIGWIKIIQGRFAQRWTKLQSKHYAHQHTHKHNGQSWMTTMIKIIFTW